MAGLSMIIDNTQRTKKFKEEKIDVKKRLNHDWEKAGDSVVC